MSETPKRETMTTDTSGSFASIPDLKKDLERLDREFEEKSTELAEVRRTRKQVADCLAALTGGIPAAEQKGGVTKADAIAALTESRRSKPNLSSAEREDDAKALLKKAGKSLNGFRMAMTAAVREVGDEPAARHPKKEEV